MDDLVQHEVVDRARAVDRDRRSVLAEWPIFGARTPSEVTLEGALYGHAGACFLTLPSAVANHGLIWVELFGPQGKVGEHGIDSDITTPPPFYVELPMFDAPSSPERTEEVVVDIGDDYTVRVVVRGGLLMNPKQIAVAAAEKAVDRIERRELLFEHPAPWQLLDGGQARAYQGRRLIAEWPLDAATDDPKRPGNIWRDQKTWGIVLPPDLANTGDVRIALRSPDHGQVAEFKLDTNTKSRPPYFIGLPSPPDAPPPPERWEEYVLMYRDYALPRRVRRGPLDDDADVLAKVNRVWPTFERVVRRLELEAAEDKLAQLAELEERS